MLDAINNKNMQIFFVFIGLVALGWTLPTLGGSSVGGITEIGFRVLAIFIAVSYAWSRTNDIWPSLLCFLLLPFTGALTFDDMLTNVQGVEIVIFIILLYVFLKFLEEREVGQFLATWLLSRKLLRGRPWVFLFVLFFAAYLVSSLINIFVGIYLLWGIGTSVSRTLGFKPYDKFPTLLALGVSVIGAISLSALPWSNNSLVMLAILTGNKLFSSPPDILRYLFFTLPVGIAIIFILLLIYKFVFRLDVQKLKKIEPDFINVEDSKMTPTRAIGLISLLVFIILMLLPEFWPNVFEAPGFIQDLTYITKIGKLIILFVILSLTRVNRQPVFNFNQLAARGIVWGTVGVFLAAIPLSASLSNPVTGIDLFLTGYLTPLFSGIPVILTFLIIGFVTVLLTNFTANIAVFLLMMPIAFAALNGTGIPAEQIAFLIIVLCTFGWLTPASSPAGMVMYANKDWLRTKEVVIYSVPVLIVMTLVAILYNYFVLGLMYPAV